MPIIDAMFDKMDLRQRHDGISGLVRGTIDIVELERFLRRPVPVTPRDGHGAASDRSSSPRSSPAFQRALESPRVAASRPSTTRRAAQVAQMLTREVQWRTAEIEQQQRIPVSRRSQRALATSPIRVKFSQETYHRGGGEAADFDYADPCIKARFDMPGSAPRSQSEQLVSGLPRWYQTLPPLPSVPFQESHMPALVPSPHWPSSDRRPATHSWARSSSSSPLSSILSPRSPTLRDFDTSKAVVQIKGVVGQKYGRALTLEDEMSPFSHGIASNF